jgi:alpha-beta hydrolase superfamily lysophospholipase
MLRALGRDPLIIKQTRIDAIYGLTDLMEAAMVNSGALKVPALILYGEHDEIIPPSAICQMVDILPDRAVSNWRMVLYPDGYHMLTRDLQATVVLRDMMTWMRNQKDRLPSGHEITRHDSRLLALSECD